MLRQRQKLFRSLSLQETDAENFPDKIFDKLLLNQRISVVKLNNFDKSMFIGKYINFETTSKCISIALKLIAGPELGWFYETKFPFFGVLHFWFSTFILHRQYCEALGLRETPRYLH